MTGPRPRPGAPDFSADLDEDLLAYMAMESEDPAGAREAWAELYRRHAEYLYGAVNRAYRNLPGGTAMVQDVVQAAFVRAFERASSFAPSGLADPQRARRRLRAWLGTIAAHALSDLLARAPERVDALLMDEIIDPEPLAGDAAFSSDSLAVSTMEAALGSLSDREQHVLRVTMLYFKPGEACQRLPNAVSEHLAADLNTTPENVRAVRNRAIKKIKALFENRGVMPGR